MSSKIGDSLFKQGRCNRVFLEIWTQIPIWAPMLKLWAVGRFFLAKILQKSSQGPTKVHFFIKTSKWEKWCPWWLRMTNAFILCNLLWKVQKGLAANREGSFNILQADIPGMWKLAPRCLTPSHVAYPWSSACECGGLNQCCVCDDSHIYDRRR